MKQEPYTPLPKDRYPQPLIDLVHSMLALDVHDRPTAKEIVEMDWLREYVFQSAREYSITSEVRAKLFGTEDAMSVTLTPLNVNIRGSARESEKEQELES
jgi:serine/threonine protein kinase